MTKRFCKNIDITDLNFIEFCINDWISHKTEKELNYRKNKKLLASFKSIHDLAIFMQNELQQHSLTLGKLTIKNVIDRSNGKPRTYVIEEPLRQLYGYVAYFGLDDLKHKIGPHQYHSDGRGPLDAVKCAQKWMNTNNVEYAVKMDLRHCYQSIHHNYVMAWMNKHVANKDLLWLIDTLMYTLPNKSLGIGSRFAIRICGLYLSDLYHEIENLSSFRGMRYFYKHMFYLDDIFIFGKKSNKLVKIVKLIKLISESYGLTIKDSWAIIDLRHSNKNACIDILGYKVYRDHVTMRRRNYIKTKKSLNKFKGDRSIKNANSFISYYGGNIKHTNSVRFCEKYNAKYYYKKARKVVSNYARSRIW